MYLSDASTRFAPARWGGTFENLESARQRLQIVVPVALLLVFVLLFAMFGNVRDGLIVFTGIPFAVSGGIVALWLRGIPFSMSAGVGFIALSGIAVLADMVIKNAEPGDHILVMSNGGFGGIHQKLLDGLAKKAQQ